MYKLVRVTDLIVSKFWIIFCLVVFCGSLVIKAEYDFGDFPYFSWNYALDLILMILILFGHFCLFKYAVKIEEKINYPMLWIVFGMIGCLFVFLIPLKPFSDMKYVTEGALLFSKGDMKGIFASDYLQMITKNLKVSMFYGIFSFLLPKTVLSFRVINVIFYLLVAHFISKVGKNLGHKYPKIIFILTASFLPLFLYCNHVYFDLPVLALCAIAVYFYTREKNWKNMLLAAIFIGMASALRVLAFLFAIAMIVDYIFHYKKELVLEHCKKLWIVIMMAIIILGIPKTCDTIVNSCFRVEDAEDESIWTLFCMGINEEEFGFMHLEAYDGSKTFDDFYNLLISRNLKQNVRLFGRKIFWEWSQGTYQAQRYAFGLNAIEYPEKFEYETPATRFVMNDNQTGRLLINSFCRAQYLAFCGLMIIGMWKMDAEDRDRYRMLIYLMFGTFLILIFYEMKSRYVMHCMIPMILLAVRGLENVREGKISSDYIKKMCE